MKFKVRTEVDIDITFPAYFFHGSNYYRFTSESKGICVCPDSEDVQMSIVIYDTVVGLVVTKGKPCTKEAFDKAYCDAYQYFTNILILGQ